MARSNQQTEANWTGVGPDAAIGVPGVDTNAPVDTPNYPTGDGTNSGEYNKRGSTTNYEVSKRVTNSVKQPGSVKRMTVAVLMNDQLPVEQVDAIEALVAAAVGINAERGDLVQVDRIPFNDTEQVQAAALIAQAQQQDLYMQIGTIAAILIGLGMVLVFVRRTFTDMQKRMIPYVVEPETPALSGPSIQLPAPATLQRNARAAYNNSTQEENDYDDFFKLPGPDEVELRLRAVARRSPETVASILQTWVEKKS